MHFPKSFLDELRNKVSISELVSKEIRLVTKGKDMIGLCPFHSEKTPSFSVNDQKGFYHCFGCGEHGDIFNFMVNYKKVSFNDAVKEIANFCGVRLPQSTPEAIKRAQRESEYYEILNYIKEFYCLQLNNHNPAKKYLLDRGVSENFIQKFEIGYSTKNSELINNLRKSYSDDAIMNCGIFKKQNDDFYSIFNKRIIFPIKNIYNKVEAFGGRSLGQEQPKYINSPETEFFHKRKSLYGINFLHKHNNMTVLIVEGYMDVISLYEHGVKNVVATLGTAATTGHLDLLWRVSDEPIFCMDGDAAGKRSMDRVAMLSLPEVQPGKSIKFAEIPGGLDPDDYVRKYGKEKFLLIVEKGYSLAEYLWRNKFLTQDFSTPENKSLIEKRSLELSKQIKNAAVSASYLDFFRKRIWETFKQSRFAPKKKVHNIRLQEKLDFVKKRSVIERCEIWLIYLICKDPVLIRDEKVHEFLQEYDFLYPLAASFFNKLLEVPLTGYWEKETKILTSQILENEILSNFFLQLDKKEINYYISSTEKWFFIVKLINIEKLKEECNSLLQKLDEASYNKALLVKKEISELEKSLNVTLKDRFV